ncbi:MAG: PorP/SprF family type IX secretion system membrane protein [Bacteroidota bacterium]|nr:PorP/SprF family type IX secretion system membrane protein [Bacteroidota bacterium]
MYNKRNSIPRVISFAILLGFSQNVFTQEIPFFTHYAFNKMLYNPAVVGAGNQINFATLSQYQYLNFRDQTPAFFGLTPNKNLGVKTNLISISAPLTQYGGIGVTYLNDRFGFEFRNHVKIDVAARFPIRQGASFAIGTELNFLEKGIDGSKLFPLSPDPSVPTEKESQSHPSFGAGIYYTDSMIKSPRFKDLWVSVSSLNLNSNTYTTNNDRVFSKTEREIHAMAGVSIINFLGSPSLKFHPSIKGTFAGYNALDLTAITEFNNKFTAGLAYRTTHDAWSILLGFNGFKNKFKNLRIGYSYAFNYQFHIIDSGTHELRLNFNMNSFY